MQKVSRLLVFFLAILILSLSCGKDKKGPTGPTNSDNTDSPGEVSGAISQPSESTLQADDLSIVSFSDEACSYLAVRALYRPTNIQKYTNKTIVTFYCHYTCES